MFEVFGESFGSGHVFLFRALSVLSEASGGKGALRSAQRLLCL